MEIENPAKKGVLEMIDTTTVFRKITNLFMLQVRHERGLTPILHPPNIRQILNIIMRLAPAVPNVATMHLRPIIMA